MESINIKNVFINERLDQSEYKDILNKLPGVKVQKVKGNSVPVTIGYEIEEVIDNGKQQLLIGKALNQVKYAAACNAGYCPGFKKITPLTNGCPFSCEYCFLQATYRSLYPYIKINVNTDDLLSELDKDINITTDRVLYNCGEMLDSLALDHITGLSKVLIPYFAKKENAYLLFLSKSANIHNLLDLEHNGHTILSWSINCEEVIDKYEHYTANLSERINAAKLCQQKGYPIRFRFDPIILIDDWKNKYANMVKYVLSNVEPEMITIGSLRFAAPVRGISKRRFKDSTLFSYEFTRPYEDGKIRYEYDDRILIYSHIINEIRKNNKEVIIGLCKEQKPMWDAVGLEYSSVRCNCLI